MTHSFIKCEAVKVSYRQTKDGMVVAFSIHPNDLPPELALAPVGTRVLLAVAEITDEESAQVEVPARSPDRSERAREQYAMKDKMAQAATRAAMLCKEDGFQGWMANGDAWPQEHRERFTTHKLRYLLGIESRSQISSDERAYNAFLALETSYKQSQGQFAEARG